MDKFNISSLFLSAKSPSPARRFSLAPSFQKSIASSSPPPTNVRRKSMFDTSMVSRIWSSYRIECEDENFLHEKWTKIIIWLIDLGGWSSAWSGWKTQCKVCKNGTTAWRSSTEYPRKSKFNSSSHCLHLSFPGDRYEMIVH